MSASSVQMENVTIVLSGVRVGPYVYNRTQQQPRSMVSMLFLSSSVTTVRNVRVLLEDCVIDITSMNYATSMQPCAFLQIPTGTGTIEKLSVRFRNSVVSLNIGGPQGSISGGGFLSITCTLITSIRQLEVHSSNSSLMFVSHQVLNVNYVTPGIVVCLCGSVNCVAENITMTSTNSTLMVREFVPGFIPNGTGGFDAVTETITVLYFSAFLKIKNVRLEVLDSAIVLSCLCTTVCDRPSVSALNAGIAWLASVPSIFSGTLRNVAIVATNTIVELDAPSKTNLVAVAYFASADTVVVTVTKCKFTSNNAGQNIGSQIRISAFVSAYTNTLATNWTIQIQDAVLISSQESGRCLVAQHAAVFFNGDIANINLMLANVTMVTAAVNGTASVYSAIPGVALAMLTTMSTLVSLQPAALPIGNVGTNVHITVCGCVVAAEHTPSLPAGASMFVIASLVCGASITISLSDSTVTLDDVHVERHFPSQAEAATWFPANAAGFRGNATGMVQFTDITAGVPATFAPFIAIITGGAAAPVRHTNVTVTLQGNCTVGYHSAYVVAPLPTDRIAFIQLPSVAIQSSYLLHGTLYRSLLLIPGAADVAFGSLAGSIGAMQLIDCNVTVRDVTAPMANLLTTFNGALQLLSTNMGRTMISFSNITMVRIIASPNAPVVLDAYQYVIGAVDGSIVVAPPPISVDNEFGLIALQLSPISIENCNFVGFTSLVDAPVLNLSLYNGRNQLEYFLHLGCNLWDSEAMSLSAVSTDAAVLRLVESNACDDNMAHTASVTKTEAIPVSALSTHYPVMFTDISAATTSGAIAVYAAVLVPVAQARSVAGLQRAIAALRLAARCAASTANATYADPMFSQLVDNPLGLPVAVGVDALQYAAGAAVGNALLALTIAALMHCLQLAKSRGVTHAIRSGNTKTSAALSYLPSSLLPGSAAMPFGKLVQPAVGACVALIVSSDRTARSVFCGAVMLSMWVAYPGYCSAMVLVRGRSVGAFLLRSEKVRHAKTTAINSFREAADFATEPTHEWAAARGSGKHASVLLRRMLPVFEAYVGWREWYFAVEWGFAMVSGAVLGAAEAVASGGDACLAAQWGVGCAVGLSAMQLLVCLWLRPFAVRLELWMALMLGGLELLSNALSLADDTGAADVVVNVAAYLELVIGVLVPLVVFVMMQGRLVVGHVSGAIRESRDQPHHGHRQGPVGAASLPNARFAPPGGARQRYREQDAQLRALIEIICRGRQQ